ncbi:GNAT family N-acetyltransferase [Nonomuraea sp. LPB2021202275-12-8]|uniref:GNAT family N-acetyltransferase n=1 Tax=Nonomuraea sp. LPB2021202275-12-8 TaxID=3120159 RepID=UPI00300D46FB
MDEVELGGGVALRPLKSNDAAEVARAYARNREHLSPWEPRRAADFYTLAGQVTRVRDQLEQRAAGRLMPWLLVDGRRVVGAVNLSGITLGAFRSASLGYWMDSGYTGRGLATSAVEVVCRVAGERLGLHRIEAGTLLHNAGSQRVLRKAGFELIGTAPRYLHIDGEWRDHLLFQRILHDRPPG